MANNLAYFNVELNADVKSVISYGFKWKNLEILKNTF
jgi:hypothetical protein